MLRPFAISVANQGLHRHVGQFARSAYPYAVFLWKGPARRLRLWSRLRQVEYVTGRRTIATAARDGALTGLWFGGFLGLLLSLFVELDEDATAIGVIVTYAVVAAAINAAFMAFRHWSQRGERDFSTKGKLDAEAYEVWVDTRHVSQARGILGITAPRHADPDA